MAQKFRAAATDGDDIVQIRATELAGAVESGKRELFVPRWYRVFALVQALFPGLSARLVARSGYRRPA